MNNILKTLNKIQDSKVLNLKSEKLELGIVQDIAKKTKQVIGAQKKLDKSVPAFEKLIEQLKNERGTLEMYMKESEGLLADVQSSAKLLGISPNDIEGYKTLDIEVSNSKTYLK
jgi:hypothetical protein